MPTPQSDEVERIVKRMTTRPPSMSPEEVERFIKSFGERGASIQFADPRLTKATNWILGVIGGLVVTFLVSMNAQIANLREQNSALFAELKAQEQINQAQDSRLNIYDDRLRAVEREVK